MNYSTVLTDQTKLPYKLQKSQSLQTDSDALPLVCIIWNNSLALRCQSELHCKEKLRQSQAYTQMMKCIPPIACYSTHITNSRKAQYLQMPLSIFALLFERDSIFSSPSMNEWMDKLVWPPPPCKRMANGAALHFCDSYTLTAGE